MTTTQSPPVTQISGAKHTPHLWQIQSKKWDQPRYRIGTKDVRGTFEPRDFQEICLYRSRFRLLETCTRAIVSGQHPSLPRGFTVRSPVSREICAISVAS